MSIQRNQDNQELGEHAKYLANALIARGNLHPDTLLVFLTIADGPQRDVLRVETFSDYLHSQEAWDKFMEHKRTLGSEVTGPDPEHPETNTGLATQAEETLQETLETLHLLHASSLGTAQARTGRRRTPPDTVKAVLDRVEGLTPPAGR